MQKNLLARLIALLINAIIIFSLNGCFADPDDTLVIPVDDPYDIQIARAWISFESGDYYTAILDFQTASGLNPLRSDAFLGMGWCYAMTDELDISLSNLELAIERDSTSPDGHAAKAFVLLAKNQYEDAVTSASLAISLGNEDYVFEQVSDVQTANLRLLIAECQYALGKYADAQLQIDIIDPGNHLDKNNRNYKQNLLIEIEKLMSNILLLENLVN